METALRSIQTLPDHARLWVYQCNRAFTPSESAEIDNALTDFVTQWAAHGAQLSAAFEIRYDRFIVLAVDEQQAMASGCSIDSSVDVMRQIEKKYQVTLLDKSLIAYLDQEEIKIIPFHKAKASIEAGAIQKETIIFNNAVASVSDWKSSWKQPAGSSWMARFFL